MGLVWYKSFQKSIVLFYFKLDFCPVNVIVLIHKNSAYIKNKNYASY